MSAEFVRKGSKRYGVTFRRYFQQHSPELHAAKDETQYPPPPPPGHLQGCSKGGLQVV